MRILNRFENKNTAYCELLEIDGTYCTKIYVPEVLSRMTVHDYKQDAIEAHQFNCYWLERNF